MRVQLDTRIKGDDAGMVGKQRIDVECPDLGTIDQQLGDRLEHLHNAGTVSRGPVPIARQKATDPRTADHVVGEHIIHWQQLHRGVPHDLHRCSARAEHQHRTEDWVGRDPDQEFLRLRTHDHLLDGKTLQLAGQSLAF